MEVVVIEKVEEIKKDIGEVLENVDQEMGKVLAADLDSVVGSLTLAFDSMSKVLKVLSAIESRKAKSVAAKEVEKVEEVKEVKEEEVFGEVETGFSSETIEE